MCAKRKTQSAQSLDNEPFQTTNDELIAELMTQRRLQQDALQKIMTFMEREQDVAKSPTEKEPRKRKIKSLFSTDKKNKGKK